MKTKLIITAFAAAVALNTPAFADKAGDAAECLEKVCVQHKGKDVCLKEGPHFKFIGGNADDPNSFGARQLATHPGLRSGEWKAWAAKKDAVEACLEGATFSKEAKQ